MLSALALACAVQSSADVESRVSALLHQMTLEEKVEILSGTKGFYTKPIDRLDIPSMKMSDGPAGVRTWGPTTAYPAPICMASAWNPQLMAQIGEAYGQDARARGVDFLLAPGVNIYRVPMNGRNFEYYGEDPFLAGQTAVGFIKGVQSEGVAATVKHYDANNQEFDRTGTNVEVDERTLREIYLPAFEAAVKQGHVWAVMASYNLINGHHATENDWLQNEVLKREWGFKGLIMSDWGATHSAANAANWGLDLEMPGGDFFTQAGLMPALKSGEVTEATIDDKVRRILRVGISIGAFDRKPPTAPAVDNPDTGAVALQAAREGMVLLKNTGNLLPLRRVKRIAVVGPNADPAVVGGGGSSQATPFHSISVLDAVKARGGSHVQVSYAAGALGDVVQAAADSVYDAPLKEDVYANTKLSGDPSATREEERISHVWRNGPVEGVGHTNFSIRWSGTITPKASGRYEFLARGDDGYRVYLNEKPVLDEWRDQGAYDSRKVVNLTGGQKYNLRVEYYQAAGDAVFRFGWRQVSGKIFAKAVSAAKSADVAIVCIGLDPQIEHEGDDRPFELPAGQDDLVQAVLKANPRTIVVLNGGGAMDLTKWIDRVPALVMAWYPGQNGNTALAQMLFGDFSPSGKMPISFARRWQDCAAYGNYPGKNHQVRYSEGIFVGYRHFDRSTVKPLFPFGFGLSYSSFRFGGLHVSKAKRGEAKVSFTVRNTGRMAADEIAQLYVAPNHPRVPRPVKELKGYARVHLAPGQAKKVTISLDPRSFSYFDMTTHGWRLDPGRYGIWVGDSSENIQLKSTIGW